MPKMNPVTRTLTGKQVEEMIFNCLHNTNYVENQVKRYFGSTKPMDIMQKWNSDIDLYKNTSADVKPLGIESAQVQSWKRYHAYVAAEGVPMVHAELYKKHPIRSSKEATFDSCRGNQLSRYYIFGLLMKPSYSQLLFIISNGDIQSMNRFAR